MADVKCLICEELFPKGIKFHLKKCHGISSKEYREMFPGAQVISDKELQEKRNRVHSPEEIAKLVERNKSQKMRDIISKRNTDPEFQKKCREGCTEETRRAQSENMRVVSKRLWNDPDYRMTKSQEMSDLMKRLNQDPEYTAIRSEIMKKTWENPENAAKMISAPKSHPYGRQSSYHSDKFDKDFWCRSQGEREFLELCDDLDQVIEVYSGEKTPIRYFDLNGESHVYLPDFIVQTVEGLYIVEVKYEDDPITNYVCKVNSAVDFCKLHNLSYCYVNRFSGISNIRNQGFKSVVVSQRI